MNIYSAKQNRIHAYLFGFFGEKLKMCDSQFCLKLNNLKCHTQMNML